MQIGECGQITNSEQLFPVPGEARDNNRVHPVYTLYIINLYILW